MAVTSYVHSNASICSYDLKLKTSTKVILLKVITRYSGTVTLIALLYDYYVYQV